MPFKMIANRLVYRFDEGKEYKKGEPFTVETEAEKNRLLRNKRASLDETKEAPAKAVKPVEASRAPVVQKVMTPDETASPHDPQSVAASMETSVSTPRPNRYRRSDMRAED